MYLQLYLEVRVTCTSKIDNIITEYLEVVTAKCHHQCHWPFTIPAERRPQSDVVDNVARNAASFASRLRSAPRRGSCQNEPPPQPPPCARKSSSDPPSGTCGGSTRYGAISSCVRGTHERKSLSRGMKNEQHMVGGTERVKL